MADVERTTVNSAPEALATAQQATLASLSKVDDHTLQQLTRLTLPEIRALQEDVAQVLPAGNLPALVLGSLIQLKDRKVSPQRVQQDIGTLFHGIKLLPEKLYGAFVAGPAAVLYAYQTLLRLAGKDVDSAFPMGTWQYYVQFSLREDTSRHANENTGFFRRYPHPDSLLAATAWVQAVMDLIYRYDDLLAVDWRERVMLREMLEAARAVDLADKAPFRTLVRDWNKARPYHSPLRSPDYLRHRVETFEVFIQERIRALPPDAQAQVRDRYAERRKTELPAYQQQMTILASLSPQLYQEEIKPIPLWRATVGFIWQGHTTLLPLCQRDAHGSPLCYPPDEDSLPISLYTHQKGLLCDAHGHIVEVDRGGRVWYADTKRPLGQLRPPSPEVIRAWLKAILTTPMAPAPELDLLMARSERAIQPKFRATLPEDTQKELTWLRRAPILINWDLHHADDLLVHIRNDHRGVGDHSLTLFRTERSMIFDSSHIFYDGMWAMAVSEILNGFAIRHYHALQKNTSPVHPLPLPALKLAATEQNLDFLRQHQLPGEAGAESGGVNMNNLARVRKHLKHHGVRMTVNDFLLLYRSFHAMNYEPSVKAQDALKVLQRRMPEERYETFSKLFESTLKRFRETNPALLIPMDATNVSPSERLYPTTYRNPLSQIPTLFTEVRSLYRTYHAQPNRSAWRAFDKARRELLAYLKAYGEFLDTLKAVTMRGESLNTALLRLVGILPKPMQSLVDQIPQRIGALNEVLKGNEVFSNVGRVALGTALTRIISAKDDGRTKELVWCILTDDEGQMHISLRDYRPFASYLVEIGEKETADLLAQDYLNSYVHGFNSFVTTLDGLCTATDRT